MPPITYYVNSGLTYEIDCMKKGMDSFNSECFVLDDYFYYETQLTFITGMENPNYQVDLSTDLDDTDDWIIDIQTTETSAYGIWEIFFEDIEEDFVGCGFIWVRNPCDGKDLTTITYDKFIKTIESQTLDTNNFGSHADTIKHDFVDYIEIVQPYAAVECMRMVDDELNPTEYEFEVVGFRYDNQLYEVPESWLRRQLDDVSEEELDDYGTYLSTMFWISFISPPQGSPYELY